MPTAPAGTLLDSLQVRNNNLVPARNSVFPTCRFVSRLGTAVLQQVVAAMEMNFTLIDEEGAPVEVFCEVFERGESVYWRAWLFGVRGPAPPPIGGKGPLTPMAGRRMGARAPSPH